MKKKDIPVIPTSSLTTQPLDRLNIVIVIGFDMVGEMTVLAPLLNFCFDLVGLNIEKFLDDDIAIPELFALLFFHAGILGDISCPLGINDGLQFLVEVEPRVWLLIHCLRCYMGNQSALALVERHYIPVFGHHHHRQIPLANTETSHRTI
jgi:hypothetical protein